MLNFGILSINRRNLNFIKKLNSLQGINLADNKIETKNFLKHRGISVPKTLFIINSKKELQNFDLENIKQKFFVIKPVFGSKGNGILIVENLGNKKYKTSGEIVSENFLKDHMDDILNGDYSLNYGYDKVFIEEKLLAGNGFEQFCEFGLSDIRVIVYNLVPVAAMVRMPTIKSFGKANLAQGGIGLGMEVGSGIIKTFYKDRKVYTKDFPPNFSHFKGFSIPFWDDILYESSKTQFFVNLGYLALDWVITQDGPKILEINARAGLEIQNVCLIPLKKRLDKINDLKVDYPEKGVEICKSLFTSKIGENISANKILYLSQYAKIISGNENKEIVLKIDISSSKNFISKNLEGFIKNNFTINLNNDISFKNFSYEIIQENDIVILGSNIIKNFFLRPISNIESKKYIIFSSINKNELELLKELDILLSNLEKKINISKILKPNNFLQELDKFINLGGKYNPIFQYDFPKENFLNKLIVEIDNIKEIYLKKGFELKSKFANIFFEKINEIYFKINLIISYSKQDFEKIELYNEKLYGKMNKELEKICEEKSFYKKSTEILGEKVDSYFFADYIKKYLIKNNLNLDIEFKFSDSNLSRISVLKKKYKIEINLGKNEIFLEKELDGIIAHEIETHLFRGINGEKTGWEILKSGTSNYLIDEEGIAVFNSLKKFPDGYEKNAMYQKYYLINQAKKLNFEELAEIGFMFKGLNYLKVFKLLTRVKKGIIDTSIKHSGAIFTKDKVYLDGYIKIKNWIDKGGDAEKLMIGKIKIEDLNFI